MKKLLTTFILITVFITGCSNNSSYNSYMERGKTAVVEAEYDKAKDFFSLALEEKNKDYEAKALCEQIDIIIEAIKLEENNKFEEAVNLYNKIEDIDSKTDTIKNTANKLKEECNQILEKIKHIENSFSDVEKLINEKKYSKAKDNINKTINIIENDKNLNDKLVKAKDLLATCDKNMDVENKKKEELEQENEKSVNKNTNLNKVYCGSGNHYVNKINYTEELSQCNGCFISRDLSSSSFNADCTNCGLESTVSRLTGICSSCDTKILPAVKTIYEDGTVIFDDGSKW